MQLSYYVKIFRSSPTYQNFEVKGCSKIEILDKTFKLNKKEYLKYQNGYIYKCDSQNREVVSDNSLPSKLNHF